jgi:hypothetical protein
VLVWLAHLARDRGRRLQSSLYAAWGGEPSVTALRHRDNFLPVELKARYHAFLSKTVPGLTLPSAWEEEQDPQKADQEYEAANAWLLAQTRDKKQFQLVFEENVNFGFRRNFWAMKPLALAVSGLSFTASLAAIWWAWASNARLPSVDTVVANALIGLYLPSRDGPRRLGTCSGHCICPPAARSMRCTAFEETTLTTEASPEQIAHPRALSSKAPIV